MSGKTAGKVLGLVGGVVGAVAATVASGGSVGIAILVGLAAGTTGASGLFIDPPAKQATKVKKAKAVLRAAGTQIVDDEIPGELRKPGAL